MILEFKPTQRQVYKIRRRLIGRSDTVEKIRYSFEGLVCVCESKVFKRLTNQVKLDDLKFTLEYYRCARCDRPPISIHVKAELDKAANPDIREWLGIREPKRT